MNKKSAVLNHIHIFLFVILIMLAADMSACSINARNGENRDSINSKIQEESGIRLGLDEIYDQVRDGARLILTYDMKANSFFGTVENTTVHTLKQVRVEVHLSNGVELGPTNPADLDPGERIAVTLAGTSSSFESWSAHPEVGESDSGEHTGGEGEGEHAGEGESEHNQGSSD